MMCWLFTLSYIFAKLQNSDGPTNVPKVTIRTDCPLDLTTLVRTLQALGAAPTHRTRMSSQKFRCGTMRYDNIANTKCRIKSPDVVRCGIKLLFHFSFEYRSPSAVSCFNLTNVSAG